MVLRQDVIKSSRDVHFGHIAGDLVAKSITNDLRDTASQQSAVIRRVLVQEDATHCVLPWFPDKSSSPTDNGAVQLQ